MCGYSIGIDCRCGRCELFLVLVSFDWRSATITLTFASASNRQCLVIGKLYFDVFLIHPREFASQLVRVLDFLDIEARLECWSTDM